MVSSSGVGEYKQRRYEVWRYAYEVGPRGVSRRGGRHAVTVGIGGRSLCVSTRGDRDVLRNRLYFAGDPYTSVEYYDGHPRGYLLPTATAGEYVAPEFHLS
uniref:DUF295 domain-containing protein n=1 Tax=Leersia perrieri TaxID=77586 RepID=A0A0D9VA46_9ORYZ